jgi:glycopeptide antibiotics resistance protein
LSRTELQPSLSPPFLTRRHYTWLALGFLALVVYGSLVPFHFESVSWDDAVARFRAACCKPVRIESRSDWAANILLFIPLSFLWMAALAVDRRWYAGLLAALFVLPGCALLSAAIEFTQLYFPPRVTSVNDIVAESLGGFLGTMLWLISGHGITNWLRHGWMLLGSPGSAARLLPTYLVLLILVHVMPLDLTLSPVEIYHKYREGRVLLIPFGNRQTDPFETASKYLTTVSYFLPVGLLLASLNSRSWQSLRNWPRVLGVGLLLAGVVQFLKLFVFTRFSDTTDVVTGGLAILAGWCVGLVIRGSPLSPATETGPGIRSATVGGSGLRCAVLLTLFLAWFGALVFINWQPFDFRLSDGIAIARLREVSWIPFADYYRQGYLHAFDEMLSKIVLFMPVGLFLALVCRQADQRLAGLLVVLLAAMLATTFEAGQLFLPSRYASVTDVLLETLGVWLGFVVGRRVVAKPTSGRHPPPGRIS